MTTPQLFVMDTPCIYYRRLKITGLLALCFAWRLKPCRNDNQNLLDRGSTPCRDDGGSVMPCQPI